MEEDGRRRWGDELRKARRGARRRKRGWGKRTISICQFSRCRCNYCSPSQPRINHTRALAKADQVWGMNISETKKDSWSWQVWFSSLNWPNLRVGSFWIRSTFAWVCTSSLLQLTVLLWILSRTLSLSCPMNDNFFLKLFAEFRCIIIHYPLSLDNSTKPLKTLSQSWGNGNCSLKCYSKKSKQICLPLKLCSLYRVFF